MTGHSLDVFTRHYADDYGRAQRDEARARMLAHGFGSESTSDSTEADEVDEHVLGDEKTLLGAGPSSIGAPRFELGTSSPPGLRRVSLYSLAEDDLVQRLPAEPGGRRVVPVREDPVIRVGAGVGWVVLARSVTVVGPGPPLSQ